MSTRANGDARRVLRPDPGLAVLLALAMACSEGAAPGPCGNGSLDPGETCDDGNAAGGDGCSPTCEAEGQTTHAVCGNGLRELGEACDDGNTNPGDGCTPACLVRLGWICPEDGPCRVRCGDGLTLGGEGCDDSNATSGDGCSETCAIEAGWSCERGSCTSICGDGQIVGSETCDDGNQRAGDGCSPSCLARDVWLPLGDLAGASSLIGATAVWSGREMIVWGGNVPYGKALASGFRFEPSSRRTVATSLVGAPLGRRNHVAVWSGTEMFVVGGMSDTRRARGDGHRYDPLRDTWRPMSSLDAPEPRTEASGVWTGAELIVWGGYQQTFPTVLHLDSGGRYDPAADVWRPMNPTGAPSPRAAPLMVSTGDAVLVWGGIESDVDGNSNLIATRHPVDGARYDPSRDVWIPTSTRGAAPARQGSGVWTGRELILVPCRDGATLLGGVRYDPARDLWSPIADFPREPRDCALTRASWTGSELVVVAGDATAIYIPTLNNWTLGPSSNDLSRRDAVQVWTGDELIVWGGEGWDPRGRMPQDGLRWRLNAPSWIPLGAAVGIHQNRRTAVLWTGSEALFWTGRDLEPSHGFRFDPRTSAWRRMSTVNAPEGDPFLPSSVWTGSELIILGSSIREDGATYIYTPATDTWRRLSPNPSTIERQITGAATTWTGSEMLVWGGAEPIRVGDAFDHRALDEGWRFDPLLDRWTPMSRVGAPGPRVEALAVWTGEEAIILGGGTFGGGSLRDTASYDPVLDRWSPIDPPPWEVDLSDVLGGVWTGSLLFVLAEGWAALYDPRTGEWERLPTENEPNVARASCVWTGTDVIVWGGMDLGANYQLTSNGARYDLALRSWFPLPSEGAPAARYGHSAVWTGSEMLIWGGQDGGLGGRFLR